MESLKINESLLLTQEKKGLTFGTDAYMLASFVSGGSKKTAVELGCGTGVISLLCQSKNKFSHIYAVEIQEIFAKLTEKNISDNGLCEKITPICMDLRELKSSHVGGEADCVFANPPYMKADSGKKNTHDEKFIARHEVCGGIGDFCACASRLLKHGGKFYAVYRPDRLTDLLYSMRENKLEPKAFVFVHAYPKATPSIVLVEAIKGGASGNRLYPPLYLSSTPEDSRNNILSPEAQRIYDTCSFEDFLKRE